MAGFPGAGQTGQAVQPKALSYRNRAASHAGGQHRLIWPNKQNKPQGCRQGCPHHLFTDLHQHGQQQRARAKSFWQQARNHLQLTAEVAAGSYTLICSSQTWGQDCQQGGHGSNYPRLVSGHCLASCYRTFYGSTLQRSLDCSFLRRDLKPKSIFRCSKHCIHSATCTYLPFTMIKYICINLYLLGFPYNKLLGH